jgi:hypothetical protein
MFLNDDKEMLQDSRSLYYRNILLERVKPVV